MASKHKNIVDDRWLSEILKRDVYRLVADDDFAKKAGEKTSRENTLLTEIQSGHVFIYARVSPDAVTAIKFLEQRGFNLIDTNVTFVKSVMPARNLTGKGTVRFTVPEDRDQVVALARNSFIYSRFHLDSAFSREEADTLRAEWVKNYYVGKRGDAMVVAEAEGVIAGFLLLIHGKDDSLIIDLIAVDEKHRRKGIARDMITYAESQSRGFRRISVGTQLANLPSIKLYEGMGFKLAVAQYTFHYHHG